MYFLVCLDSALPVNDGGGSFSLLVVVVEITLVNKNHIDDIARIQIPVTEPRPEVVVTIYVFDLLVVSGELEGRAYLFSSFIPKASVSNIFITVSSRSCACLATSPTGLI